MSSHDWEQIGNAIVSLLFILLFTVLRAWIGVALWNAIMVKIFGLPVLTFWQFYGLIFLLRILLPGRGMRTKKED